MVLILKCAPSLTENKCNSANLIKQLVVLYASEKKNIFQEAGTPELLQKDILLRKNL